MRIAALLFLGVATAGRADPASSPEITRGPSRPQAVGVRHALRTIPEACARVDGTFTGNTAQPYRFEVVNPDPRCHPRVRLRDAVEARPSVATGWILNDVIRVARVDCPAQVAQLTVWRKPSTQPRVGQDRFGATRVNIGGAHDTLKSRGGIEALPQYALQTHVEGAGCRSP